MRTGPAPGPFCFDRAKRGERSGRARERPGAAIPMNFFEVFGLDRKLAIDAAALQRRFYELSREHHPDFHQAAPADAQARVLEASARVNAAYRALRDPIARVEYLIRL